MRGSQIKICIISYYFYPLHAGGGMQMLNLAKKLKEKEGVEVIFIAAKLGDLKKHEVYEGFGVCRASVIGEGTMALLSYWVSLGFLLFKKRKKYDLILSCELTVANFSVGIMGKLLNKVTIGRTSMDGDVDFKNTGRIFGILHSWLFKLLDAHIAISSKLYRDLTKIDGNRKNTVNIIQNGVDIEKYKPVDCNQKDKLKSELHITAKKIVLFVGVIDSRKGVDTLVDAWIDNIEKLQDTVLLIVGPLFDKNNKFWDQNFHKKIIKQVDNFGMGTINVLGNKNNISDYMQIADVFVLPSRNEGMPNVILEAMSSGLPVISTDISGSNDLVKEGINGYLFDYGDSKVLGKLLVNLIHDKDLRNIFGDKSRQLILENNSFDMNAEKYIKLFKKLL